MITIGHYNRHILDQRPATQRSLEKGHDVQATAVLLLIIIIILFLLLLLLLFHCNYRGRWLNTENNKNYNNIIIIFKASKELESLTLKLNLDIASHWLFLRQRWLTIVSLSTKL